MTNDHDNEMVDAHNHSQSQDVTTLTIHHARQTTRVPISSSAPLSAAATAIANALDIPLDRLKLLVSPKPGLLALPFDATAPAAETLLQQAAHPRFRITALGSSRSESAARQATAQKASQHADARSRFMRDYRTTVSFTTPRTQGGVADSQYTFHAFKPLPYLPEPDRALALLHRLAADPGVRTTMSRHRFTVGLLSEMDPGLHTTADAAGGVGRTLGLNHNRGASIDLRLRTDDYCGFRDYRGIRKTLCHELAHNVHGPHDAQFWSLCRTIEREVEGTDYWKGGRAIGDGPALYGPVEEEPDMGAAVDGGGLEGGEYVLGGDDGGQEGMSRRDILARAAEERMKHKQKQ